MAFDLVDTVKMNPRSGLRLRPCGHLEGANSHHDDMRTPELVEPVDIAQGTEQVLQHGLVPTPGDTYAAD